jgi:hypothetical protein
MKSLQEEIERLRLKKLELLSKLNLTYDFDEREEYEKEIEKIDEQIKLLEKLL